MTRGGETLYEWYRPGDDASTPHPLYSGTKSFWGIVALSAQEDGLLTLDEPVSATFSAWGEGAKARVTLRMLLQLVAGIGFGGLGNAVPTYDRALAVELKTEPGTTFTYGGIPVQVFGAVLAKKLAGRTLTPHEYLRERVLVPNGADVASWRRLRDGTSPLPTGAFVAPAQWARFGRFVLAGRARFGTCFVGSNANGRYGLGWWLSPLPSEPGLVYASGAGGQGLYLIPSHDAVAVKFGKGGSFDHAAFLRRLLERG